MKAKKPVHAFGSHGKKTKKNHPAGHEHMPPAFREPGDVHAMHSGRPRVPELPEWLRILNHNTALTKLNQIVDLAARSKRRLEPILALHLNAAVLKYYGFSAGLLRLRRFSLEDLVALDYRKADLKEAGFDDREIDSARKKLHKGKPKL